MRWKPIIAAVDRSPEAIQAAALAWNIAKAAGAQFHLVNVAREVLVPPTGGGPLVDTAEINRAIRDSNRMRTEAVLRHGLADEVAERLEVRVGNASAGRTLLGSTVGGLLNNLPASLLIVPCSAG